MNHTQIMRPKLLGYHMNQSDFEGAERVAWKTRAGGIKGEFALPRSPQCLVFENQSW